MVLKEAFRMQNHLDDLASEAEAFLADPSNLVTKEETHLRKQANPAAEDEAVSVRPDTGLDVVKVVELLLDIHSEREALALAIDKAKASANISIDASLLANKDRQSVVLVLSRMLAFKTKETVGTARDYLINADGNQAPYVYKVKTVESINFDRTAVAGIAKKLAKKADEVSLEIDRLNLTLEVDHAAKYPVDCSFEEAYESFTAKKG